MKTYCQDCNWRGNSSDCHPVTNLTQRVAVGEPMPVGQCPKCGALCQELEGIEELIEAARQHGLQSEADHEVGDLQMIARAMWGALTDPSRRCIMAEFKDLVEEWQP